MVPPCTERGDDDDDAMVPLAPKPFNSKEFKLEEYPVLKLAIDQWNVINEPKEANAGCALLKRIQDCAVGSGRCEMPRRENGKVTLTAGQVRAALCHAILCNATDPVGEQRWGSEVTKPANRSAGKEYGQSGGLVWNKFLGKTDVDGDGNKPNVDGDGKKPNVSPMAVQRALALLAYFEAATKENFDDKRRISFTLHEGDASLLTTLHNPPTQIKFPEVSVHHGDIDKETVLGSWYVKEIDKETVLRKDSALVNFANYVYGYGEMSKSKNGVSMEEALQVQYPELLVGMFYYGALKDTQCIVTQGVQKFSESEGTMESWQFSRAIPQSAESKTILTMDAQNFNPYIPRHPADPEKGDRYFKQFEREQVKRDLLKATLTFQTQTEKHVSTGGWGCGQFRCNPYLKFLQQYLAAAHANLTLMSFSCWGKKASALHQTRTFRALMKAIEECKVTTSNLLDFLLNLEPKQDMKEMHHSVFLRWVCDWLEKNRGDSADANHGALHALRSEAEWEADKFDASEVFVAPPKRELSSDCASEVVKARKLQ